MVNTALALLGRSPQATGADCQSWQCRMLGLTSRTRRYSTAAPQKNPNLCRRGTQQAGGTAGFSGDQLAGEKGVSDAAETAPQKHQHTPDVVVVASVDAAPPEVAVLWLQECCVEALYHTVPHADKGAAPGEATILVQTINLGEGRGGTGGEAQGNRSTTHEQPGNKHNSIKSSCTRQCHHEPISLRQSHLVVVYAVILGYDDLHIIALLLDSAGQGCHHITHATNLGNGRHLNSNVHHLHVGV